MTQYTITVEPWPTPDSPPDYWQGDVAIDGEIVIEYTMPGDAVAHLFRGVELLVEYLESED